MAYPKAYVKRKLPKEANTRVSVAAAAKAMAAVTGAGAAAAVAESKDEVSGAYCVFGTVEGHCRIRQMAHFEAHKFPWHDLGIFSSQGSAVRHPSDTRHISSSGTVA